MFHDNFHDGWISYEKKDYEAAQKLWLPLASQGNSRAQFYLGRMYDKGQGIPQDYNEAVKWYQLAADRGKTNVYRIAKKGVTPALNILTDDAKQGIAEAQVALGVMHEYGYSFPQDNNEALKWFQLAANQGYNQGKENIYRIAKKGVAAALNILTDDAKKGALEAQLTLGSMYVNGKGVAKDSKKAFN
ncbi:MAG: sel1 repeat family protein, partial [Nitrospina sp.]|nr:sel1 repeat family protein [Nitrospina sp.]MBT7682015.1 sel1 repeat family protein [Nitrospina sp.]